MTVRNVFCIPCTFLVCLGLICLGTFHAFAQSLPVLPDIDISQSDTGVVDMPEYADDVFKAFAKYTKIYAPNGKPIHIVAYSGISDEQIVYARKVLVNHLTNVAGSLYGSDKTSIANALADNDAIMAFYINRASMETDAVRNFERSGVKSQAQHTPPPIMEGTALYMKNDPRRDATYEEVLHFVQDYGTNDASPELSEKLWSAYRNALAKGLYTREDTETNEYFICGLEAYFDIFKHDPGGDGTREQEYMPITREGMKEVDPAMKEVDPAMYEIIEGFFGPTWLYTAEIADEFDGTFLLTRDENLDYTNKSLHLRKAMLAGRNDSNLTGNNADNSLFGNSGDNIITPLAGSDVVDGGPGSDTVVFPGDRKDYIVRHQDGRIIVEGIDFMRDGYNILINIENLQFNDGEIGVKDL